MSLDLNETEARIIGCLIEKENTTPDYYPLTLNALTNACNQKSNRNPVVDYDEQVVQQTLESLLSKDFVYLFYGSGSRTPKYKHLLPTVLDLDHPSTAIICVLLLRGAQTLGELNQRTSRIYQFSGLDEVHKTVDELMKRDEPLIVALPKQPGQKEARFAHLLSGEVDMESVSFEPAVKSLGQSSSRIGELEQKVGSLETELNSFREEFDEFRKQFE
ncbi:MAG: DUF480 domain-containing protein [Pyrinomonadaceae bacterium]|nr:DUF480 domain-containing protein [Pyrinomonadaceae bacterium]